MIKKLKEVNATDKRVLLRVDLNLTKDLRGRIVDDFRLRVVLPTIRYLISKKAKVIIMSHFGSPGGKPDKKLTLAPIAKLMARYLKKKVSFISEVVGPKVESRIAKLALGQVAMIENLRFDPREEENTVSFVKQLAKLGDIYVNDAFSVAHRNHASIVGVPKILPAYIGPLFEKEIKILEKVRTKPRHPFIVLVGGVKLATKLPILNYFKNKADSILIGGALANNFLVARGFKVGRSFYEPNLVGDAKKLLAVGKIILPSDLVVVANKSGSGIVRTISLGRVEEGEYIYDFGPKTIKGFIGIIKKAKTILWNGPLGLDEIIKFRVSTDSIARAIASAKAFSVVGGGNTVIVLDRLKIIDKFDYVSTGGGAMLEYLGKGKLPGLGALDR
ncbi:phosphoglycerate kinase [Candidatus Azambacteria bacterium RIFCSPHIGHO2_01_FULL_44_55]|nr:MAG: phosphoglycerate kinase [Candidatus Azambacteria bacterium RIFCSPLOWO2_01_FULL_44_84]OGD33483.1 MAG: phosphoglycerate kinase [Candidatus Azambacteria bacterium RIFCSPHIGHO2_02_FULL_45_18]OGD40940.1 MAG: phosphoglycerate kinase [Candidatus Azambacteria bacterium RIFCSPHIGHO2_01_FULL_44_55]